MEPHAVRGIPDAVTENPVAATDFFCHCDRSARQVTRSGARLLCAALRRSPSKSPRPTSAPCGFAPPPSRESWKRAEGMVRQIPSGTFPAKSIGNFNHLTKNKTTMKEITVAARTATSPPTKRPPPQRAPSRPNSGCRSWSWQHPMALTWLLQIRQVHTVSPHKQKMLTVCRIL